MRSRFSHSKPRRQWFTSGGVHRLVAITFASLAILPWLVAWMSTKPNFTGLAHALRGLYGLQCHQREFRSFSWGGQLLPVCARCVGIYGGLGFAAWVGCPRLRPGPFKAWFLVGALLIALDVATEFVGLRPPSAWFRALTGAFLSYAIALSILQALRARQGERSV